VQGCSEGRVPVLYRRVHQAGEDELRAGRAVCCESSPHGSRKGRLEKGHLVIPPGDLDWRLLVGLRNKWYLAGRLLHLPKGEREQEHGMKKAERDKYLSRVGQLGRLW